MPLGPFDPIPAGEKIRRSHINDVRTAIGALETAYDVAVANGFVGSEADWLATLVGPEGPAGPPGAGTQEGETTGQAVAGIALDDGAGGAVETWLGTTADGGPTSYAITKLEDAGIGSGGGAVDSVNGQTGAVVLDAADVGATAGPVALGSAWGTYREHPRLSKPLTAPILTYANQDASTMYWPVFVDRRAMGGAGVSLLYSTDHHAGLGGIYGAHADSPLGPFTDDGLLYQDTTVGDQTETPAVIWDEANDRYNLYYHNEGMSGTTAAQTTIRATTTNLTAFTRQGVILDGVGANHTGYFRPFRYAGTWYGWSLYTSATPPVFALWSSPDGATWTKIGEPDPEPALITGLAGYASGWIVKWYHGDVILWRGRPWWIGLIGPSASGATVLPLPVYAAPLNDDLMSFAAQPVDITPAAQAWEQGGISNVGGAIVWDNRLFVPYRGGDTAQVGFGVMEVL